MNEKNANVFTADIFEGRGIAAEHAAILAQRANKLLYLGGSFGDIMAKVDDLDAKANSGSLERFEVALDDLNKKLMQNPPSTRMKEINNRPETKAAKDFVVALLASTKDMKLFGRLSKSEDYPNGLLGELIYTRQLDFLIWEHEHGLTDEVTFKQKIEQSVNDVVNVLPKYLAQRNQVFQSLLNETERSARVVEGSPYPQNYLGDIQKDLAEPVKAKNTARHEIDLDVLRDLEIRMEAIASVTDAIKANEAQISRLEKVNDNFKYHIDKGILSIYQEPKMKSKHRGVTVTHYDKGKKVSREFRHENPELFGIDNIHDKKGRDGTLSQEQLAAIRKKAQSAYKPDNKSAVTRQDILDARLNLRNAQIEKIIAKSEELLVEYRDSQKTKIISELQSIFQGPAFAKLNPSDDHINQQIDAALQRVEENLRIKIDRYEAPEVGTVPSVEAQDPLAVITDEMLASIIKATADNPNYAADVVEKKYSQLYPLLEFTMQLNQAMAKETDGPTQEKMQSFYNDHIKDNLVEMVLEQLHKFQDNKSEAVARTQKFLAKLDRPTLESIAEQTANSKQDQKAIGKLKTPRSVRQGPAILRWHTAKVSLNSLVQSAIHAAAERQISDQSTLKK